MRSNYSGAKAPGSSAIRISKASTSVWSAGTTSAYSSSARSSNASARSSSSSAPGRISRRTIATTSAAAASRSQRNPRRRHPTDQETTAPKLARSLPLPPGSAPRIEECLSASCPVAGVAVAIQVAGGRRTSPPRTCQLSRDCGEVVGPSSGTHHRRDGRMSWKIPSAGPGVTSSLAGCSWQWRPCLDSFLFACRWAAVGRRSCLDGLSQRPSTETALPPSGTAGKSLASWRSRVSWHSSSPCVRNSKRNGSDPTPRPADSPPCEFPLLCGGSMRRSGLL